MFSRALRMPNPSQMGQGTVFAKLILLGGRALHGITALGPSTGISGLERVVRTVWLGRSLLLRPEWGSSVLGMRDRETAAPSPVSSQPCAQLPAICFLTQTQAPSTTSLLGSPPCEVPAGYGLTLSIKALLSPLGSQAGGAVACLVGRDCPHGTLS